MASFQALPPELRIYIWRLTTEPRLVDFVFTCSGSSKQWHVKTTTPPPVLLHVNRESRSETLSSHIHVRLRRRLKHKSASNGTSSPTEEGQESSTEAYFDPSQDTISIVDGNPQYPSFNDTNVVTKLLTAARARHVKLDAAFWLSNSFSDIARSILNISAVQTLSFHNSHGRLASPMFRIIKTNSTPRPPVATWIPTDAMDTSEGYDEPSMLGSLSGSWAFSPVRDTLKKDGAVLFNHRTQCGGTGLAVLLVIDQNTFPDEFIWGLAARGSLLWRHGMGHPQLPPEGFADDWKRKIFRHMDGVCVANFGLDLGQRRPPYDATQWDADWVSDATSGTVARIAQNDLRMPFLGHQFNYNDRSWQAVDRKAWVDAMLWDKYAGGWSGGGCDGSWVDAEGGVIGTEERQLIETSMKLHLPLGVWRPGEATTAEPVPDRVILGTRR